MSQEFWQTFQEIQSSGQPFVMATLVETQGSTPQDMGAKMLVNETGLLAGTVGGGKVEHAAIETAQKMIRENQTNQIVTWNLQKDIGMTCGGIVRIFFEQMQASNWHIAIFGAGHVANALIPGLLRLNCSISCIDARSVWLDKITESPRLKKIELENPADYLRQLSKNSYVLLMSQGHSTDFPVLLEALRSNNFPYLGVIGSKSKRATLIRELRAAGISPERSEEFYCPIGLPIGNSSPEEISISVMAQLLEVRDRLPASSSTER
ncbi:MAG: xanthine dehydrogenase accessory protein XdhC [Spirochaetia bacterium]|nr:xanthine dehydrogenase accessory protein XdhC [Spirochaetia bacterium]